MSGLLVGIALAAVLAAVWALLTTVAARRAQPSAELTGARNALGGFAAQSLELESLLDILHLAREVAEAIFACQRFVVFQSTGEDGGWVGFAPGEQELAEVPATMRGALAWFKHNPAICTSDALGESRFGAMRRPLEQIMQLYELDVVLPLVDRQQVIAVVGLRLGRALTADDRELLRLFRLQTTAACANVRLHREAAQVVSLAQEVDLASAVQIGLVPAQLEGRSNGVRWAGSMRASGDAGSDFWAVYAQDEHVLMLIGDAVGSGLAGSMVSAVVKSCADTLVEAQGVLAPAAMLTALSSALRGEGSHARCSCFAIGLHPRSGEISYANAGHDVPYRLRAIGLGALAGSGPLLGDEASPVYRERRVQVASGEVIVLYTDGLVEAKDAANRSFGHRRLQKLLATLGPADPTRVRDAVLGELQQFHGAAELGDDVGLVIVRLD